MSRRSVGLILLAVASIALGVFAALLFFHTFESTLSEQCLRDGSRGSTTAAVRTLMHGITTGGALFVWSLLIVLVAPLFRKKAPPPALPEAPPTNAEAPH